MAPPLQTAFPNAGLRVPNIAVGCSRLGIDQSPAEACRFVSAAVDHGLTFFDTADVYGEGLSEELLGTALGASRDRCVIATKFRYGGPVPGAGRKSARVAVEASLRRLGTDYIDVFLLHGPDPVTPLSETISALRDLVRAGKILYYGLCNVSESALRQACDIADGGEGGRLLCVQSQINLISLPSQASLRRATARVGVGLLAASPLARGLLARGYNREDPPTDGHDLLSAKGVEYWTDYGMAVAQRVGALARQKDVEPVHIALAAVLAVPEVVAAVARPRDVGQMRSFVEASAVRLSQEELSFLFGDASAGEGQKTGATHRTGRNAATPGSTLTSGLAVTEGRKM